MKILIVDTYYPGYLKQQKNLIGKLHHEAAQNKLRESLFGTGDFYSKNLSYFGIEAKEIIPNSKELQKKYWQEKGSFLNTFRLNLPYQLNRVPVLNKLGLHTSSYENYILEHVNEMQPDVVYSQDLSFITPTCADKIRSRGVKKIIGQIACPPPDVSFLKIYDLILTSFPHFVTRFRDLGINCEYFKIGFEHTILERINTFHSRDIVCSFVGGISKNHSSTIPMLEAASEAVDLSIYGYGAGNLDHKLSPLHYGEAWGAEMYKYLAKSLITLNRHIDVAENYANNMRLYEATGMGACLVTDMKDNLHELFKIDEEVVTYSSLGELKDKLLYLKNNPKVASEIGKKGQQRTLKDHSYYERMRELANILQRYC